MFKKMEEWANTNKCQRDNVIEPCQNKEYYPKSILEHVAKKLEDYMCHFAIQHYLSSLYCNNNDKLHKCVCNNAVIPDPNQQYMELMN